MRRRFDEEDIVSGGAGSAVVVHDYVAGVSVPLEVGESYTMSGYNWAQSGLFAIELNEVGVGVSIYPSTEFQSRNLELYDGYIDFTGSYVMQSEGTIGQYTVVAQSDDVTMTWTRKGFGEKEVEGANKMIIVRKQ